MGRRNVSPASNNSDLFSSHYNVVPKLNCLVFDPESLPQDKLSLLNFYEEFENCVLSVKNNFLLLILKKKSSERIRSKDHKSSFHFRSKF